MALLALWGAPVAAQLEVPSGQALELYDLRIENGATARFRFKATAMDDGLAYGDLAADFPYLCAVYALPALEANEIEVTQIVIALSDREITFGEADPDARQFIEAFGVIDGKCVWEQF